MPTPTPDTAPTLRQLADRHERIFPFYPRVERYFPAAAMEAARQRLGRAIERGNGPAVLIGAPGTGKSLLLQVLAAQYHERFDVVLLACARLCTRRALLQAILFELGLPYKSRDEGELRLSLLDHLLSAEQCPAGLLLLVDEAQTLPIALLDELRVLTNLVRCGAPRVRLVLAGSAALEEAFASAELESFSQRLAARCYLAPLSRDETTQFIRAHIAAAGGAPEALFNEDAYLAVFEASDGVPRLVNQLADRAVDIALSRGQTIVDAQVMQAAWADLQQLPTPWEMPTASSSSKVAAASPVVEFGSLSDGAVNEEAALPSGLDGAGSITEIEPTELDDEDDWVEKSPVITTTPQVSANSAAGSDPFAEEFDEEEVVLDNFAAWDDMFGQLMPRVENRRDPGFAQRVQSAIEASALKEDIEPSAIADEQPTSVATKQTWPPLRLAVISEPAPLQPIPLLPPAQKTASGSVYEELRRAQTTPKLGELPDTSFAHDGPPILVIEEDASPQPPVRRENYRNLFSRLRSG